jgi:hypothetical protein
MKTRIAVVVGVVLLFGSMAFAQDDHKLEVTGDYSYIHVNPQNNNIVRTFSLNGGGGSVAYFPVSTSESRESWRATEATRTPLPSPTQRTALVADLAPLRSKGICSLITKDQS